MSTIEILKASVNAELSNYTVYFSPTEMPDSVVIPSNWSGFGLRHASSVWLPSGWEMFSSVLPTVDKWLKQCVIGTALAVRDQPYLVYIYRENDEIGLYLGGIPTTKKGEIMDVLQHSPLLERFYTKLHDGFSFYIDASMGPSRIEDFVSIDDLLDDEPPTLTGLTGIFSNGAGDFITILNQFERPEFSIWWHEKQSKPEANIDVWAVIDAWMGIFLENADSNEGLIGANMYPPLILVPNWLSNTHLGHFQ